MNAMNQNDKQQAIAKAAYAALESITTLGHAINDMDVSTMGQEEAKEALHETMYQAFSRGGWSAEFYTAFTRMLSDACLTAQERDERCRRHIRMASAKNMDARIVE